MQLQILEFCGKRQLLSRENAGGKLDVSTGFAQGASMSRDFDSPWKPQTADKLRAPTTDCAEKFSVHPRPTIDEKYLSFAQLLFAEGVM